MIPSIRDIMNDADREVLPVKRVPRYESDNGCPPRITETHEVHDSHGSIMCQCRDRKTAQYIVDVLNIVHADKQTAIARRELRNHVVGTIVVQGEIIPKDHKWYPRLDDDSVVRYIRSADYRQYLGKFTKDKAKLWSMNLNRPYKGARIYLSVVFHVSKAVDTYNIGDCIATVVDGLIHAKVVNGGGDVAVAGVLQSGFRKCEAGYERTEIIVMTDEKQRRKVAQ